MKQNTVKKYIISSISTILLIVLNTSIYAQIITVKQDGTGDFTQIQQAIDLAFTGDTILVYPGRYYENLNYIGKGLVIGSLNMTTGDASYIGSTIIDGNQTGSCVLLDNDEQGACIYGFTIENGSGTYNSIFYTIGGGVCIREDCSIDIINCIIQNNYSDYFGGGISAKKANLYLSGTTIRNNHSHTSGGGIAYSYYTTIFFDTVNLCNIYNNYAIAGSDIYKGTYCDPLSFKVDTFTVAQPTHYFLFSYNGYTYYSGNDIECDMQHSVIEQVSGDLYVSPDGDDSNDGTTPDTPLQHLYYALLKTLPDSNEMHNIYLSPGTWSPSMGELFPLHPRSFTKIIGYHRDSCFFDAEQQTYHLKSNIQDNNFTIKNLTLTNGLGDVNYLSFGRGSSSFGGSNNITLDSILFCNNRGVRVSVGGASACGGAVFNDLVFENNIGPTVFSISTQSYNYVVPFIRDTISFTNCRFANNINDTVSGLLGGGKALSLRGEYLPEKEGYIVCKLFNCEFVENHAPLSDYAQHITMLENSHNYLINCTVGNNTTPSTNWGSMGVSTDAKLFMYNSILYNNQPGEMYIWSDPNYWLWDSTEVYIYNSLIDGGEEGIVVTSPQSRLYYESGNIDTDPLWDTSNQQFPYSLQANSPCVDAGTLDIPDWLEFPETDLAGNPRIVGNSIDMGAYEYDPSVQVDELNGNTNPMMNVYPNPMSDVLYISYQIKTKAHIKLDIYDINGILVRTLVNMQTYPGKGQLKWDGKNKTGNIMPPGTYLVSLTVNDKETETIKVLKR